jgi:hypothetical protein
MKRSFGKFGSITRSLTKLTIVIVALCIMPTAIIWLGGGSAENVANVSTRSVSSLRALLALPAQDLDQIDVARVNVLVAQELPGAEMLNIEGCLWQLDQWAAHIRAETGRHRYRFENNPAEFENSPRFFCMLMLAVVLAEDFQIRYVPDRRINPSDSSERDGFFADSQDVFLHGLLGTRRQGTCSSLPVLYVAVGRRLGYPLKLVTTKAHLFVRWEGQGERFNIEAAGQGLSRYPDDYYRKWPFAIAQEEEQSERYLKSLSAPEELAVFLSIRGMCLQEAGRLGEASEAFAVAARLAPSCRSYTQMQQRLAGVPQKTL